MLTPLILVAQAIVADPICTDRPAKANAVCTVPAGRLQLETSLAGWSLTRSAGSRVTTLAAGATVGKIGLSERSDLQIGIVPVVRLSSRSGNLRSRSSGFGDVVVRYKHRLTADGARLQVGAIPFVKLPTAKRSLGNGELEGGLALPIAVGLPKAATLTFGPEINLLADADGRGRHLALVNLVNLSGPVAPRWSVAGELWSNINYDPARTVRQASLNAAVIHALSSDLQVDAGVNLGLTRDTADVELYLGTSARF